MNFKHFKALWRKRTKRPKKRARFFRRLEPLEPRRLLAGDLTLTIDVAAISENGGEAIATVTRSNVPDLTQSLTLDLSSSDTTEATVPPNVTIPVNQESATFTIAAVDDNFLDGIQTVTIWAGSFAFSSDTETLDVLDHEPLTLTIAADDISEAGGATTATVSRDTDTTDPLVVDLVSDDATEATVVAQVTIPAGAATSAAFDIIAVDDAMVDGTQIVTITAVAAGHDDGSDTLEVTDDETPALTLAIAAADISEAGGATTATVSRKDRKSV
ncbi:MAG: hypothetical protein VB875_17300, partial [Pirellulales bacterium]